MSEHAAVTRGNGAPTPPGVPSDRLLQDWKLARERALTYLAALEVPVADRAALAAEAVERALRSPQWAADGDAIAMTLRALRELLVERDPPDAGADAARLDRFVAWRLRQLTRREVGRLPVCQSRLWAMPRITRRRMVPEWIERRFARRMFNRFFRARQPPVTGFFTTC